MANLLFTSPLAGFVMLVAGICMGLTIIQKLKHALRPYDDYEVRQPVSRPKPPSQPARYVVTGFVRICPHCGVDQPEQDICTACGLHRDAPPRPWYYKPPIEPQPFCYSCGDDLVPGADFCITCGKPAPKFGKTIELKETR